MGVTSVLARWASTSVHVLVVEVPGSDESRMLLEAELDRRGWSVALSPADADLLAVCGIPGNELRTACDLVWNQLPGPRSRASVTTAAALSALLDGAAAHLVDDSRQREDARVRSQHVAATDPTPDADEHEGMSHEDMDHGGIDRGMDHGAMDHGGMDMPMPGGIPLAGGGDDRDGLEMDVLNVPLGPVLPHWPAGLVVDCVLQGDVIVSAQARILPAASASASEEAMTGVVDARRRVIRLCDQASQLLALAGWQAAAQNARRLRDASLRGADLTDHGAELDRLRRRVERSTLLRWSLKGLTLTGSATRDVGADLSIRHRLIGWLREAAELAGTTPGGRPIAGHDANRAQEAQDLLDALPDLLRGTDLGTARLLIAGLGLDTAALREAHERSHD